jgi:hypothetical protein
MPQHAGKTGNCAIDDVVDTAARCRKGAPATWEDGIMLFWWSTLLIIHGILAVFLVGAITHQAVGVSWPVTKRSAGFVSAIRGVNGMTYTNVVVILFVVTFILGTIIYPTYRISVRTVLQEYRLFKPEGMFEMKEHLLALSLALLPIYWLLWRKASEANRLARAVLTSMIAVAVWWSFLTGHIINNIRGFGS